MIWITGALALVGVGGIILGSRYRQAELLAGIGFFLTSFFGGVTVGLLL